MIRNPKFRNRAVFFVLGFFLFISAKPALAVVPADPLFTADSTALAKQWYLPRLGILEAWEETTGGSVTVAVVDTGIDGKHEDLNDGRVGKGWASYCARKNASNPDLCDQKIVRDIAPGENSDDNGHGTVVAGIIGAIPNNNKGMAGINWNIRLMPIKVLGPDGTGVASDLAAGIRWATDNGAKIINLSIGGDGLSGGEVITEAVAYAWSKGALVIAAAGNDSSENGLNLNTSPAVPVCADGAQNYVLGVAAVDVADKKAKFSNYGSNCIDLASPGTGTFVSSLEKQGMISTYFDPSSPNEHGLYVYAIGTSVAAPMVSGVAALVLSINPDLDAKSLRDRLLASVDNIDEVNRLGCGSGTCVGQIGSGRINAKKAVSTESPYASGTLIRNETNTTYIVENGFKRPISEYVLKQRFADLPITAVTNIQAGAITTGPAVPPVDGALLKEPEAPIVYMVEGGRLHGLSYLAFVSRNLHFSDVAVLSKTEISTYLRASDSSVLNGLLIKSSGNPAVFVVNNGLRQLLSYFVWQQQFANAEIAQVSDIELQNFPMISVNFLYAPRDGTLIRGDLEPIVYLMVSGKKRGLNLQAFLNRGYSFDDVHVLPQSEIIGYETGEDIIE